MCVCIYTLLSENHIAIEYLLKYAKVNQLNLNGGRTHRCPKTPCGLTLGREVGAQKNLHIEKRLGYMERRFSLSVGRMNISCASGQQLLDDCSCLCVQISFNRIKNTNCILNELKRFHPPSVKNV